MYLNASEFSKAFPTRESLIKAMPGGDIIFPDLPAKIDFFAVLPKMGEIDQSLINRFHNDPAFFQTSNNFHEDLHFVREVPVPVGSHAAEVLVARKIPSHGVKLSFQFHQLAHDSMNGGQFPSRFVKGEVFLMNVGGHVRKIQKRSACVQSGEMVIAQDEPTSEDAKNSERR
jgi:hypothetical protein